MLIQRSHGEPELNANDTRRDHGQRASQSSGSGRFLLSFGSEGAFFLVRDPNWTASAAGGFWENTGIWGCRLLRPSIDPCLML